MHVPASRGAQWGEVGCPEAEVGESMLPSSEGFLADDLGPDVNLQGMHNSDLEKIHHAAVIRGVPGR